MFCAEDCRCVQLFASTGCVSIRILAILASSELFLGMSTGPRVVILPSPLTITISRGISQSTGAPLLYHSPQSNIYSCAIMSVPRTLLHSSQAARSFTTLATRLTCLSSRSSVPSRKIATSSKFLQENLDTSSRGHGDPRTSFTSPSSIHARSIALFGMNKRTSPSEIESFLKSKGLEMYVYSFQPLSRSS